MSDLPDRSTFADLYSRKAPWDIGKPQPPFVEIADRIIGPVLDAGCGTGDTAIFLAARGHRVVGFDFLEEPIRRARAKAAERGLTVEFRVSDALKLDEWNERFNSVIDSGLFHTFGDEDRRKYVAGLGHVLNPSGYLFLICFSDREPPGAGPRRVSQSELREAFSVGWVVESIQPTKIEINPEFTEFTFAAGGPQAWFAVIRRA